ncbi:TolA protein [Vulgatibacter incomptus]|uniref:TolA protein n=1 Tax=Vulgatibacter incomptus TaxID=1391653 RepID=A0A0K1PFB8_9BACT|nr:TolA protein [Vulgatibacter incomptus]
MSSAAERALAERLAAELSDGPEAFRVRSAARLVEVAGELAVPAIANVLGSVNVRTRAALVELLGRAGGALAFDTVRGLQRDPDASIRAAAVDAAVRLSGDDPRALEIVLLDAIDDPDPRVRRRAALGAASARGIDPGPILAPLLSDEDKQGRRLAAIALGSTRDPDAALALIDSLLDVEETVRSAASASAEQLFGPDAAGIAELPELQRGRAAARLRARVAANLWRLAPEGVLTAREEIAASSFARGGSDAGILADEEVASVVADLADAAGLADILAYEAAMAASSAAQELRSGALDAEPAEIEVALAAEGSRDAEDVVETAGAIEPETVLEAEAEAAFEAEGALEASAVPEASAAPEADVALEVEAALEADVVPAPEAARDAAGALETAAAYESGAALEAEFEGEPASPAGGDEPAFDAIEALLLAALRGMEDSALAAELGYSPLALVPVIEEHLAAGRIVRRGRKLFLP